MDGEAPIDTHTHRILVASIEAEFRRYQETAEAAILQLDDHQLHEAPTPTDNTIATIMVHLSGNFRSRFTDFLMSDGEKPWRDRDREFDVPPTERAELLERLKGGWDTLYGALSELSDADLGREVSIRGVPLPVHQALHRALAHASYHVGQVVYVAKWLQGPRWAYLTIPPGGSAEYNRSPTRERRALPPPIDPGSPE